MLRYWGDIPMKLETSQPDLSNAFMAKTDRDVIMDTLMVDLEEATKLCLGLVRTDIPQSM